MDKTMIKMDEHKFFKATKWVDHDNNEPFYNRPEQRHAMPCHASILPAPCGSGLHYQSAQNTWDPNGCHLGDAWDPTGIRS